MAKEFTVNDKIRFYLLYNFHLYHYRRDLYGLVFREFVSQSVDYEFNSLV